MSSALLCTCTCLSLHCGEEGGNGVLRTRSNPKNYITPQVMNRSTSVIPQLGRPREVKMSSSESPQ